MNYIAIDQYGKTIPLFSKHPRKELLEILGYSYCRKMYMDGPNNTPIHKGYVIGPFWLTVYKTEPFKG